MEPQLPVPLALWIKELLAASPGTTMVIALQPLSATFTKAVQPVVKFGGWPPALWQDEQIFEFRMA